MELYVTLFCVFQTCLYFHNLKIKKDKICIKKFFNLKGNAQTQRMNL